MALDLSPGRSTLRQRWSPAADDLGLSDGKSAENESRHRRGAFSEPSLGESCRAAAPGPHRQSVARRAFHSLRDIFPGSFDRNKIRIVGTRRNVTSWYGLIPFLGGRSSLGWWRQENFSALNQGTESKAARSDREDPCSIALAQRAGTLPCASSSAMRQRHSLWAGLVLLGNAGNSRSDFLFRVTIALNREPCCCLFAAPDRGRVDGTRVRASVQQGVTTFGFCESWYRGGFI